MENRKTSAVGVPLYDRHDPPQMKRLYLSFLLLAVTSTADAQVGATLAASNLSSQERRQILTAVEQSAYDVPESWDDELRVTVVDLGSSRGVVLRGTNLLCGATGNCQLFVLRHVGTRWVSMFGTKQAPLAASFTLGPTVTRGIKDLTIVSNVGGQTERRVRFRFDGSVYRNLPN